MVYEILLWLQLVGSLRPINQLHAGLPNSEHAIRGGVHSQLQHHVCSVGYGDIYYNCDSWENSMAVKVVEEVIKATEEEVGLVEAITPNQEQTNSQGQIKEKGPVLIEIRRP